MAQKVYNDNLANELTEQLLDGLSSYNICAVLSINFEKLTGIHVSKVHLP